MKDSTKRLKQSFKKIFNFYLFCLLKNLIETLNVNVPFSWHVKLNIFASGHKLHKRSQTLIKKNQGVPLLGCWYKAIVSKWIYRHQCWLHSYRAICRWKLLHLWQDAYSYDKKKASGDIISSCQKPKNLVWKNAFQNDDSSLCITMRAVFMHRHETV